MRGRARSINERERVYMWQKARRVSTTRELCVGRARGFGTLKMGDVRRRRDSNGGEYYKGRSHGFALSPSLRKYTRPDQPPFLARQPAGPPSTPPDLSIDPPPRRRPSARRQPARTCSLHAHPACPQSVMQSYTRTNTYVS